MASDNRETRYVVTSSVTDTAYLNVANNTDSLLSFPCQSALDGSIEIIASAGPNNNNTYGFFYLGAMVLEYQPDTIIPPNLELINPDGGEFWQAGRFVDIEWRSTTQLPAILQYSTDHGSTWLNIDTLGPFQQSYTWQVPAASSSQCLLRVSSDTLIDHSAALFQISPSTDSCLIVVIGSSTAAGAGASVSDSAWVNRYRKAVYQDDTRFLVHNLAQGGYTSFHLLPNGHPLSGTAGINVDTNRNISKALQLDASAVIINLPSNDAALGFSVFDQIQNFEIIVDEARQQGVDVWVCTTQPRNFSNQAMIQVQREVRDSILLKYGAYAIDFWTGIADTNGHIRSQYNSGDGVHLNDAGHALLFHRVMDESIPDSICGAIPVNIEDRAWQGSYDYKLYPNPYRKSFTLEISSEIVAKAKLELYDAMGRMIICKSGVISAGSNTRFLLETPASYSGSQLNFLRVGITAADGYSEEVFTIVRMK